MNGRLKKVRDEIKNRGLDALLITSPLNRDYLLDIDFPTGGVCLITKKNSYFLTDFCHFGEVNTKISDSWNVKLIQQGLVKSLEKILKNKGLKIGIEPDYLSLSRYRELKKIKKIKFISVKNLVEKIRVIKDKDEIKNLKKACIIIEKSFSYILKSLKVGITEKEVANKLEYFLRREGDVAFGTIIASGVRSSFPHGVASEKKLNYRDIIVIDFGVKYKGYHTDFTRTIFIGKTDKKKRSLYSIVLESQQRAIDKIKDGIPCKEVDREARNFIEKMGYGKYFGHGLGHGVGRNIHEEPYLERGSKTVLKENMVVTVEPAIYIPGRFGIRIEDTVLVKKNGCEILTDIPKNIMEI